MYFSIVIMALLTISVFVYVFSLEKTEMNLFGRIFVALLNGVGGLFTYLVSIFIIIEHYSGVHELPANYAPIGYGVTIGFVWLIFIISLFLLKGFLGAVLSRDRTIFLSD